MRAIRLLSTLLAVAGGSLDEPPEGIVPLPSSPNLSNSLKIGKIYDACTVGSLPLLSMDMAYYKAISLVAVSALVGGTAGGTTS